MSKSIALGAKEIGTDIVSETSISASKSFVRNCEVAHHSVQPAERIPSTSLNIDKEENDISLTEPKPYSSIKIADYMRIINDIGCRKVKVPPEKGKFSKSKGLKKINIPLDEQVYKGLIDLEVRDEELGINIGTIKPKDYNKQKDVEPALSDYYKPKFNREYIVKPSPPVFEATKTWTFKGTTVLTAMNRWECKIKD